MKPIKITSDQWDYIEKNGRICVTKDDLSVGEWVELQYWLSPQACYTIDLKVLEKIPLVGNRNDYVYELINPQAIIVR
jgi:hypothetical protein